MEYEIDAYLSNISLCSTNDKITTVEKIDQSIKKDQIIRHPSYVTSQNLEQNQQNNSDCLSFNEINPFASTINQDSYRKNSNAIKKYGRILIKHSQKFQLDKKNNGFQKMIYDLKCKQLNRRIEKDLSDNFNTLNLIALFQNCSSQISTFNLKTVDGLLARKLRRQILSSIQLRDQNKIIYLNTLKCCKLRLCNKRLAVRLEVPYWCNS